jgi:purine-nucleoside/S-methyl-5'-thioadenosine phosphorylase / adenosine deaminase
MTALSPLQSPILQRMSGLRHAFYTRRGGVSEGIYDSLNCGLGSGDGRDAVIENRRRAMEFLALPEPALVTNFQIHSPDVVVVDKPWPRDERPRADGLVTRQPGVALGILTADCAPLLFADEAAGVIGAAHAGWRGAVSGVAEATVAAMAKLGADVSRIRGAIGPCIAQDSYEVGPEFPAAFLAQDKANERFFRPSRRAGHFMFDLPGYLESRLEAIGLADIGIVARDTCAETESFFSYRRTTLSGGKDYGRGLSAIALGG